MKSPILGSAYVTRSVNTADNQMINLFPEIIPEGGKEPAFLSRAPGLTLMATAGIGPVRGTYSFGGYLFVVSGDSLYRVDANYTVSLIGAVNSPTNGPVSMAASTSQLFIACNGPSWVYNIVTGVFAAVVDPQFPGAGTVTYIAGYFVINQPGTQLVWWSNFDDGTNWDSVDNVGVRGSSSNAQAVLVDHQELWVFSSDDVEVWYNTGDGTALLAPIQGAVNEFGIAAPFTLAKLDNSLFWLGKDARGQGVVYRSSGYRGVRVSTHAVEWQIQQYANLSDATAYSYQHDGHLFYVLTIPSADTTWAYDVATEAWHQRASFSNGAFHRHQSSFQTFFNNLNLVGDYQNGNIYSLDLTNYSDNGSIQKWLRSWRALPTGQNDLKRTAHHSLQVDCETGVGLNSGQGVDPQMILRWSDDGGHTWSNERWNSMGAIGAYGSRAIWRRLGMTQKLRDRVYEISGTDPVKIAIMGAELDVSPTNA